MSFFSTLYYLNHGISNFLVRRFESEPPPSTLLPMNNLIEYSDNYSKTFGSLWKYYKDIPVGNNNGNIVNLNGVNATDSFNRNR